VSALLLSRAEPVNIDVGRRRQAIERAQRRHRNSAPPELHVGFAHVEHVGGFGGTDAGALKGSVEPRGHGAAKGVVLVTAFEVSDGLGMSPHVLISLDLYLIRFKR